MTFEKIFPAEFTMGDGKDEENFKHRVRITKPYFLGKYGVTQHCWAKIMGDNPSKHKAVDYPVSQISWEQANDFCTRLSNLPEEQQAQKDPTGFPPKQSGSMPAERVHRIPLAPATTSLKMKHAFPMNSIQL